MNIYIWAWCSLSFKYCFTLTDIIWVDSLCIYVSTAVFRSLLFQRQETLNTFVISASKGNSSGMRKKKKNAYRCSYNKRQKQSVSVYIYILLFFFSHKGFYFFFIFTVRKWFSSKKKRKRYLSATSIISIWFSTHIRLLLWFVFLLLPSKTRLFYYVS